MGRYIIIYILYSNCDPPSVPPDRVPDVTVASLPRRRRCVKPWFSRYPFWTCHARFMYTYYRMNYYSPTFELIKQRRARTPRNIRVGRGTSNLSFCIRHFLFFFFYYLERLRVYLPIRVYVSTVVFFYRYIIMETILGLFYNIYFIANCLRS